MFVQFLFFWNFSLIHLKSKFSQLIVWYLFSHLFLCFPHFACFAPSFFVLMTSPCAFLILFLFIHGPLFNLFSVFSWFSECFGQSTSFSVVLLFPVFYVVALSPFASVLVRACVCCVFLSLSVLVGACVLVRTGLCWFVSVRACLCVSVFVCGSVRLCLSVLCECVRLSLVPKDSVPKLW